MVLKIEFDGFLDLVHAELSVDLGLEACGVECLGLENDLKVLGKGLLGQPVVQKE